MHLGTCLFLRYGLHNANVVIGFNVHVWVGELIPDEMFSDGYPLLFPASRFEVR